MAIKKISVSNFKNFKNLEIELGNLSIVIGANASGKSNFVSILRFLRDIVNNGLDNALQMQGGFDQLRSIKMDESEVFSVEVVCDPEYRRIIRDVGIKTTETIYRFEIKGQEADDGYQILEDVLTQKCDVHKVVEKNGKYDVKEKIAEGEIIARIRDRKLHIETKLPKNAEKLVHQSLEFLTKTEVPITTNELMLETPLLFVLVPPCERVLSQISVYDFHPKKSKDSSPITGKADLTEDGGNLSIVLNRIIRDQEKQRKFSNLVRDLLPFVDAMTVDRLEDKSLLFKIREIFFPDKELPAPAISDGTINVSALIVALYFESEPLSIIEEPERNLHPFLISKVVKMLQETSERKQIVVTTHNPELVRHADLKHLLLLSRGKDGFSSVSRPAESLDVRAFLENEIGVDELFVRNLLSGK